MIIGITGGSGCGKTTLLELIRRHGGLVLDCDKIYHRLLETDQSMLRAICDRFPQAVENGQLQRKNLGAIVFEDKAALSDLNQITHSAVKKEVLSKLSASPALAAIDAIGLFESGLDALCDVTVAVTAPEQMRIARLMARDQISEDYARARIRAQRPQEEFQALCQYTLYNDGAMDAFEKKCIAFLADLGILNTPTIL